MPIKVSCDCGQRFRAKKELAGKRLKCPNCGRPLEVPLAFEEDQAIVIAPPTDGGEEYHLAPSDADSEA